MPEAARIGVVVLNWNGAADTIECIESLAAADPRPAHVVVVDNDSSDDSVVRLRTWAADAGFGGVVVSGRTGELPGEGCPWLVVLTSDRNRGFAGGNNLGLRFLHERCEATHFLLLNNDATVQADTFAALRRAVAEGHGGGLLTGTIYRGRGEAKEVWYAGGRAIPLRALVAHELELPDRPEPRPTEFISGCAMLVSRPALERLGLLAEIYFPLYWEDVEYSHRAIRCGLPVVYDPRAVFHHRVGSTVGLAATSPRVAECQNRLRALFVRRNFTGLTRIAALGYLAATKPARALVEALRGRPGIGWAILRGTATGFFMHPRWAGDDRVEPAP